MQIFAMRLIQDCVFHFNKNHGSYNSAEFNTVLFESLWWLNKPRVLVI
jgi:hypothetical protein